jgi:hypothetical protein
MKYEICLSSPIHPTSTNPASMSTTMTVKSIFSGAIFGAAVTAAGVYAPSVIIAQMKLQDFHMMKAFVAASASSA